MKRYSVTAQKMKFSIKDFFSKCDQIRMETVDLVKFTEEILNGKLRFLCSVCQTHLEAFIQRVTSRNESKMISWLSRNF